MNAIKKAAKLCGSQLELARLLGVTQGAVCQWVNGGRLVPAGRCRTIEALTSGEVTCDELRPDIFGPVDIGSA